MSYASRQFAQNWINHYSRKDTNHHIKGSDTEANRRTLVVVPFSIVIDDRLGAGRLDTFTTLTDTELDLNTAANWDTVTPTDYTVAATRAGKDFYYYACIPASGNVPVIKLSANSTYPSGYTANNSRKIGGFHALPYVTAPTWLADTVTTVNYVVQPVTPGATKLLYRCTARAGDYKTHAATEPTWPTVVGETVVDDQVTWTCDANGCENLVNGTDPYYGFLMGDILFNSIWDLCDRPRSSPEGMAKVSLTPTDGIKSLWIDIYLANGTGTTCTSVHNATIKDTVTWLDHVDYGGLQGKRLLSDDEFQVCASGSNEETAIAGAADRATSIFPLDSVGRSMISKYGLIACCGHQWQWLLDSNFRLDVDGAYNSAAQTSNITYVASLEGAPVYLKTTLPFPHLCADIAADVWIAFGSYKVCIHADAAPATGGTQIYFDDDASHPHKLLSVVTSAQNAFVPSNHPSFFLKITYDASAATNGVELRYDNVTHSRLEAVNAHGVTSPTDMAWIVPGFTYHDLPGAKGSAQIQGTYGNSIKMMAGGCYSSSTYAGSRARSMAYHKWYATAIACARFASEAI